MINYNSDKLKHLLYEKENLNYSIKGYNEAILKAEQICEAFLGCTLRIRKEKFIISMLEIYYGSIEDKAHDWYRTHYIYKNSKYKEHTEKQLEKGIKLYLSTLKDDDTYQRMDFVIGNEGVAVSLLLRRIHNMDFSKMCNNNSKGEPHNILKKMGIKNSDHGKPIQFLDEDNNDYKSIVIIDTHRDIYNKFNLITKTKKRINVKTEFEEKNSLNWNFSAEREKN
jgi:hypothetical protein